MSQRKGSRKQLAQELDIPMTQINKVVAAVHKQLRRPVPDATLLDHIRRNPQSRELFKQIQKNLFPPESVAPQSINLPQQPLFLPDDLIHPEIHQLAKVLAMPIPEASALYDQVAEQVKVPFAAADLLASVTPLSTTESIVDPLVEALEIRLLSSKLNLPEEQVRQLPDNIMDHFRLPATYNDILQFLEIATPPVSVQDIRNYFYREWKSAYSLVPILHISDGDAWRFMVQIRELVSWSVPHDQLIKTVHNLPHQQRNPVDIALALDLQHIAQRLRLPSLEASNLLTVIRQTLSDSISNRQIINAIPFFDLQTSEPYEKQFETLWEIATAREQSMEQAGQFFLEIKAKSAPSTTYEEILDAFYEAPTQNISVASVLSHLVEQQTARRANMTRDEFAYLPKKISEEIDATVTQQDIIWVIQKLGAEASAQSVKEYFWEKQYPIPQMAVALNIKASEVRVRLRQIKQEVHIEVGDDEILAAIDSLAAKNRKNAAIVNQIYARQTASQLLANPQEASNLVAEIHRKTGLDVSGQEMAVALEVLPAENKTVTDLIGLLQAKAAWNKSIPEAMSLAQEILSKLHEPVPLIEFWSLLQGISPALGNEAGIIVYFNLQHLLKNNAPDTATLNRLAIAIAQHPYKARFWDYVALCNSPNGLTVKDFDHLLQLLNWSILRVLTPDKSKKEQWVTYLSLDSLLREKLSRIYLPSISQQRQQTTALKRYAQDCWTSICSQERQYQVPSYGRVEIIVPTAITSFLNLHSVRFAQEKIKAPGLFIRFEFENPTLIGIIRIDPSGDISGFHQLVNDAWFQALIEAIALSHYRDLVVPNQLQLPSRLPRSHRPTDSRAGIPGNRTTKTFPTLRTNPKRHSLADWYESQEIARHSVRGHIRWISPDFVATDERHNQAKKAGVSLKVGYTWVIEHERGNPQPTKIPLDGEDLTEHTIFTSPPKAEFELTKILAYQR